MSVFLDFACLDCVLQTNRSTVDESTAVESPAPVTVPQRRPAPVLLKKKVMLPPKRASQPLDEPVIAETPSLAATHEEQPDVVVEPTQLPTVTTAARVPASSFTKPSK